MSTIDTTELMLDWHSVKALADVALTNEVAKPHLRHIVLFVHPTRPCIKGMGVANPYYAIATRRSEWWWDMPNHRIVMLPAMMVRDFRPKFALGQPQSVYLTATPVTNHDIMELRLSVPDQVSDISRVNGEMCARMPREMLSGSWFREDITNKMPQRFSIDARRIDPVVTAFRKLGVETMEFVGNRPGDTLKPVQLTGSGGRWDVRAALMVKP